jgi:hypothetical protein
VDGGRAGGHGGGGPTPPHAGEVVALPSVAPPTTSSLDPASASQRMWQNFFNQCFVVGEASLSCGALPVQDVLDAEPYLYLGLTALTLLEATLRSLAVDGFQLSDGMLLSETGKCVVQLCCVQPLGRKGALAVGAGLLTLLALVGPTPTPRCPVLCGCLSVSAGLHSLVHGATTGEG